MDCLTWPELDLDDWTEGLLAPLQGRRYPIGGTLELTERCNLGCVHCYINQPAGSRAAHERELTTAQVAGILDQVAEAGCLYLLLTGGEVLLRRDFEQIYRHARGRGILVSLFTNGTLLTPAIADTLAASRPQGIEITLYGATQATYEAVTKAPGSYARCRKGIELALERKLPLALKAVLLTTNRHELPAMQALAEELGVKFRYDGTLWPRLDGDEQPYEYRLSLREMIVLDREDPSRQQAWDALAGSFSGQLIRSEHVYSCGAGFRSFHIDAAGRLCACIMARQPAFDLLESSFQEAWSALEAVVQRKRELDTACRTCTVGALCSQCPGWSQAVHGDDETPVDFVCKLGHMRAAEAQRNLA